MDLNYCWIFYSSPFPPTPLTLKPHSSNTLTRFSSWVKGRKWYNRKITSVQKTPILRHWPRGRCGGVNISPGGASFTALILGVDHCSEKHVSNSVCVHPAVVKKWQKRGGQPWQLIEPVDGFHPNEVRAVTWWLLKVYFFIIINESIYSFLSCFIPERVWSDVHTCVR